jgi:hypothetical protein
LTSQIADERRPCQSSAWARPTRFEIEIVHRFTALQGAGEATEEAGVVFISDRSHIFKDAEGTLPRTRRRTRGFLQGVVKPENLIGTRAPGGSIGVYHETFPDGRQV